jgi:penicillin-binding protein 1C
LKFKKKYIVRYLSIALAVFLLIVLVIPSPRFAEPCSTVVLSSDGQLLGARIAADGQWRFPPNDTVPEKFKTCLIQFEDRYFRFHPGINPVAIGRALVQNIKAGKVVSGGSTISMQVARIAGKGKKRTITNKIIEIFSAIKLELLRSKSKIIGLYASNAPFGGNLVGLDAACWRYFGHASKHLSWAEAATLAVLPNAPSLIYPGNNDQQLIVKRNKLLKRLLDQHIIEPMDYQLALQESLPLKPYALPDHSFHLTERLKKTNPGEQIRSSIDYTLQLHLSELAKEHLNHLAAQQVFNVSAMVLDVKNNRVKAYIGNSPTSDLVANNNQVDMISASRSTGSILKPFLYAAMLTDGEMLPNTLLPDVPLYLSGYSPKNFDYSFHGAVPASQALSWSLNIPAIHMLKLYGIDRFLDKLKKMGFSTFSKSSDHYGLSLILGGGETSLWELCSAYSGLSRTLNHFNLHGNYDSNNFAPPSLLFDSKKIKTNPGDKILDAASIWFTFQSLLEVNRPENFAGWENFYSSRQVAYKTGTSFGFRDAWAIATTPDYVVGVWAGNSNGEGRPGLTGINAAAPLLFNIINLFPASAPHRQPESAITFAEVCHHSGHRAGKNCAEIETVLIPEAGLKTEACSYCQAVKIEEEDQTKEINSKFRIEKWFILPPAMEFYYRKYHPSYLPLPVNAINPKSDIPSMEFIYPGDNDKIYIPRTMDGTPGNVVFEVAHRLSSARIFWHLDRQYIGETRYIHQKALNPAPGQHLITLTDENGNTLKRWFTILNSVNEPKEE